MARSSSFIDTWLARVRGPQTEGEQFPTSEPASHPRGFSEGPGRRSKRLLHEIEDSDGLPMDDISVTPAEPAISSVPFSSTGPTGHRARMRERVLLHGAGALADYELLEMLLFFAFKKGDTKPLAKALINRFGSFAALLSAPQLALRETPGLGSHSVVAIKLVQEAGQRLARAEVMDKPLLGNWDRLMEYLATVLAREKIEQFRILFLDPRNRLIADEAQARGTVNHTPVYPREVVKRALELHATAIILVHNHPSGDPTPSRADIEMTAEIRDACGVLGVVLHDHVIIGNGAWLSFRKKGLLG
jgi:DNA repair protein RadC